MTWFRTLVGFDERDAEQVRANLALRGERLLSLVNGRDLACGRLELPSLAELRARAPVRPGRPNTLREVVGDVQRLHCEPAHAGALFQAASQFNLLEMPDPGVSPDDGIAAYESDRTQGPACAVACGAGTIHRSYLVPVGGGVGQTAGRQVDCLAELGAALGNVDGRLWRMRNGYALLTPEGLEALGPRLDALAEAERDALRGLLRVGVQWDTEVTLTAAGTRVTQVYGAALPVAYGGGRPGQWEALARLILEASYEATLLAAAENSARTGNPRVFLTLLGGGVFGNPEGWILAAIERALATLGGGGLDVAIVSHGRSKPGVAALVDRSGTPG